MNVDVGYLELERFDLAPMILDSVKEEAAAEDKLLAKTRDVSCIRVNRWRSCRPLLLFMVSNAEDSYDRIVFVIFRRCYDLVHHFLPSRDGNGGCREAQSLGRWWQCRAR